MLLVICTKPHTDGGYTDRLAGLTEHFIAARHKPQIIIRVLRETDQDFDYRHKLALI